MASPYEPSPFERRMYYNGVSVDLPELLYRSDWSENPFPEPTGRGIQHVPTKTALGVFDTRLKHVWHSVAPKIRDGLMARKIRYSAIQAARFVTHGEDGENALGPVVIWIATYPGSTTADDAHVASTDILALLKSDGVHGAVVEWIEGAVEKLSGPALLDVTRATNPAYYVRRFLTAALGMPIATAEREADDVQGSVAFFFHEGKDQRGNVSKRVLGVSNCHVLRRNIAVSYLFEGASAPPQQIRLAGVRRFKRGLDDIKAAITDMTTRAETLAQDVAQMNQDPDKNVDQMNFLGASLANMKTDITSLEAFYKDVSTQWDPITRRTIGHVDWAPEVAVDVSGHGYMRDIGTFEVDAERFEGHFKGNVVDLGAKYSPRELAERFHSDANERNVFKFPANRLLRINGCYTRELLLKPDTFDNNGEPCIIVMKDGNTSDLTIGHYAGLEAYTCDDLGLQSIELAIYNHDKHDFSAKGDSGSLVFDGQGKMVGIIHSGLTGPGSVVTYATPAWWAVEQIKGQYPHADFNRERF